MDTMIKIVRQKMIRIDLTVDTINYFFTLTPYSSNR